MSEDRAKEKSGQRRWEVWVADLRSGLSTALVGLPQDINYGLLAIAPLGLAYAGLGVTMAVLATLAAVLIGLALGEHAGRIVGPRPTLVILLAGLFAALLQTSGFSPDQAALYAALTLVCSGFILLLSARFGAGRLVQHLPFAVLGGFTSGIGCTLLVAAVPLALGAGLGAGNGMGYGLGGGSWWEGSIEPAALLVTLAVVVLAIRPCKAFGLGHVPATVQGLIFGFAVAELIAALSGLSGLSGVGTGPTLADLIDRVVDPALLIPASWPRPELDQLVIVFQYALAIALAAAIETLASSASLDVRQERRTRGQEELKRLGGTLLLLAPTGMPVAGALGRSISLQSAGGTTRWAHCSYFASLLALVLFAFPYFSGLPQAAIAGVLIATARSMIEPNLRWAWQAVRSAEAGAQRWRSLADFLILVLVVVVTLAHSFISGLITGIVCAMLLFIRDQSRSVLRRRASGREVRSLRLRGPQARAQLERYGEEIAVLEVQGTLFFGSADRLVEEVEALPGTVCEVVIDLRRVRDVDATSVALLGQLARRLAARPALLTLASLGAVPNLRAQFLHLGPVAGLNPSHWYDDLDLALEQAENRLLQRRPPEGDAEGDGVLRCAFDDSELSSGLEPAEVARLEPHLHRRTVPSDGFLFREGDTGDSLFVIVRGSISVRLPQGNAQRSRIAAFGPGAVVGEIAFLRGTPRSADALADEESEVLEFDRAALHTLEREEPQLAAALMQAIAMILAERLRGTTERYRALLQD